MELTLYLKYFTKFGITLKAMFGKPLTLLTCLPVLAIPAFTTVQKALLLLALVFILDFITGICASVIEFKKTLLPEQQGLSKRYAIKSAKLRLSAVKFIIYGLMILISYGIEWAFISGDFEPHSKLNKMTLTTLVVAFCSVIEIYSILFENAKRMGFDIIQSIKKISSEGHKLYKNIKGENNAAN